jgi:hypothetical protein
MLRTNVEWVGQLSLLSKRLTGGKGRLERAFCSIPFIN